MKQNKVMTQKDIVKVLRYASNDLPDLTNKIQRFTNDVLDLDISNIVDENLTHYLGIFSDPFSSYESAIAYLAI